MNAVPRFTVFCILAFHIILTAGHSIGTPEGAPGLRQQEERYQGCGEIKGCFGSPSGCVEERSCEMLVGYALTGDNDVNFEIIGRSGFSNPYVAFGLSDDGKMVSLFSKFC